MHRALLIALLLLAAEPSRADATAAAITFLEEQGYEIVEVERTWLGRVQIEATRDGNRRELIINPRTGEVLRDLVQPGDGTSDEDGRDFSPFQPGRDPEDFADPSIDRTDMEDRDDADRDDADRDDADRDDADGPDTDSDSDTDTDSDSDSGSDSDSDSDSDGGDD
ncbi:MAG: hypothetical protein AAGD12_03840 [Pseudomonadota bacterium]